MLAIRALVASVRSPLACLNSGIACVECEAWYHRSYPLLGSSKYDELGYNSIFGCVLSVTHHIIVILHFNLLALLKFRRVINVKFKKKYRAKWRGFLGFSQSQALRYIYWLHSYNSESPLQLS